MCTLPLTTQILSDAYSLETGSSFTKDQLTKAAITTRDYTVESHDLATLLDTLSEININKDQGQTHNSNWTALDSIAQNPTAYSTQEIFTLLDSLSERYVLSSEAVSHLDDVHQVISLTTKILIIIALCALCGCIAIGTTSNQKILGRTLVLASTCVLAFIVLLALWAILDFDRFFQTLHTLLFAEGTWTFSENSLLIRMYPTEFWIGMGASWLTTTLITSVICLILGSLLRKRGKL